MTAERQTSGSVYLLGIGEWDKKSKHCLLHRAMSFFDSLAFWSATTII